MITMRQIEIAADLILEDLGIAAVCSASIDHAGTLHLDIQPEPAKSDLIRFAARFEALGINWMSVWQ